MAEHVVCVGARTFSYADCSGRSPISTLQSKIAPLALLACEIFDNAPPFMVFAMDRTGKSPVNATLLKMVDDCRFVNKKLVAVPWTWVLHWANFFTSDKGHLFLSRLTMGTDKKQLRTKSRKRKHVSPLEDLASYSCSNIRHQTICATSRILTLNMIDRSHYDQTGVILCTRCSMTMRQWSGDGYLNLVTIRPVLNHMEKDPEIVHLIDMLLSMCNLTSDMIDYMRFGNIRLGRVPVDFRLSLDCLFSNANIDLSRIDPNRNWRHFGLKSSMELEIALHAAYAYRFFGHVELQSSARHSAIAAHIPADFFDIQAFLPVPGNIELISLSVLSPDLIKSVFCDPVRRVVSYVHIYVFDIDRIDLPGVLSLSFQQFMNLSNTDFPTRNSATLVLWPAHTFTVHEFTTVWKWTQPVVLVGTPFLVPERDLYGLFFTDLVRETDLTHINFLGADESVTKTLFKFDPVPINFLPTNRFISIPCPFYEENNALYFDRIILTGLLCTLTKLRHEIRHVSFIPGELNSPTQLSLAVSGKHVRASHRDRTI